MAGDTKAFASRTRLALQGSAAGPEPAYYGADEPLAGAPRAEAPPAPAVAASLAAAPALSFQIDRLFRAQAPRLMRFLTRRTGRPEDAADILQESFLRLIRAVAAESLPAPKASPEAYLQQIATNLLRDRSRRRITHAEALHDPIDEQVLVDKGPGPAESLVAQDLLRAYETALLALRPKTRLIFLLHRRDGLTYSQIAAEAGISVSGVEKHMMKAIAHIDSALGRP